MPAFSQYPAQVQERIRHFEDSVGVVRYMIKGQPAPTLADRMAHYNVKGLSIAVINDGKVEWARGYGWADVEAKRPVTTETLFEPGSISKSLNAMGVLSLVEKGKLSLDSDINTYLKSWRFPYDTVSHGKIITLMHLLSHTAGLSVHGFRGYLKGEELPTLPQILDGAPPANSPPVRSEFEPGLRHQYSGGGTMISEMMAMDASGMPYDKLIYKTVFKPLGMSSSFFTQPPPAKYADRLATGYTDGGNAMPTHYPILLEQAAGGLWTTPSDLCKFIIEMQQSAEGKSNKVLSQAMTQTMLTPYLNPDAALGVFIEDRNGHLWFQHSAGNYGFCGKYYGSLEEGKGVVVFMNSEYSYQLIDEVIQAVANVYDFPGMERAEAPVEKEVISLTSEQMERYTGIYSDTVQHAYVGITREGDKLFFHGSPERWEALFTSPTDFFSVESLSEKHFILSPEGKVLGYSRTMDGKELSRPTRLEPVTIPASLQEKYVGEYADPRGGSISIVIQNGRLWLSGGAEEYLMRFVSEDSFILLEDFGATYQFTSEGTSEIKGMIAKTRQEEIELKKVK